MADHHEQHLFTHLVLSIDIFRTPHSELYVKDVYMVTRIIGKDAWIFSQSTISSTSIDTDASLVSCIVENSHQLGKHAAAPCICYDFTIKCFSNCIETW